MQKISDRMELKNFSKTIDPEIKTELYDVISCINIDNALNLLSEVNIYFTKMKNSSLYSIDEIISPLENKLKLYLNFKKYVLKLSIGQIKQIKDIILCTKNKDAAERKIMKVAPILFNDITRDEFIDTFEIFNKKFNKINKIKVDDDDEEDNDEKDVITLNNKLIEENKQNMR